MLHGMCSEKQLESFQQFLQNEFCVENLFFWRAVHEFKQFCGPGLVESPTTTTDSTTLLSSATNAGASSSPPSFPSKQHLLEHATHLYQHYVRKGAPLQVILSSAVFENFTRLLEECKSENTSVEAARQQLLNVAEESQNQVYMLMKNDVFPRYLETCQPISDLP